MSPEYVQKGELTYAGLLCGHTLTCAICHFLTSMADLCYASRAGPIVDIFAFGVVMLEMITSLSPFAVPVPGPQNQFLDLVVITRPARERFMRFDQGPMLAFLDTKLGTTA